MIASSLSTCFQKHYINYRTQVGLSQLVYHDEELLNRFCESIVSDLSHSYRNQTTASLQCISSLWALVQRSISSMYRYLHLYQRDFYL